MKLVISLLSFVLLLLSFSEIYMIRPGPTIIATKGAVWPHPQSQSKSEQFLTLDYKNFQIKVPQNYNCETLPTVVNRYKTIISTEHRLLVAKEPEKKKKQNQTDENFALNSTEENEQNQTDKNFALNATKENEQNQTDKNFAGFLSLLLVTLDGICDDDEYPSIDMKEDYKLIVTSENAQLSSKTVWGIMRGLETFSQLLYVADDRKTLRMNINTIVDFPRFPHRGLLLDTSRHYIPYIKILDTLNAMAYNKLNVFHWHIVDDESFPYVSQKFPELSKMGAYTRFHIYTQRDIKTLIKVARERGIRVILEFGSPAHTRSWGESHKELLTECFKHGSATGELGPIDPSKKDTFIFMEALFEDVSKVFSDKYIHIGGNGLDDDCWLSNPAIKSFQLNNSASLESYYFKRIFDIITNLNSSSIVWDEVFSKGVELPEDTIVQVLEKGDTLQKVVDSGRRALLSSCWFLDNVGSGGDWKKYYRCEPYKQIKEKSRNLLLGGEALMWSEVVNENNVISRVWPRASAIAEKLWSSEELSSTDRAAPRLEEHTCRMNRRRIKAPPPTAPGFCL